MPSPVPSPGYPQARRHPPNYLAGKGTGSHRKEVGKNRVQHRAATLCLAAWAGDLLPARLPVLLLRETGRVREACPSTIEENSMVDELPCFHGGSPFPLDGRVSGLRRHPRGVLGTNHGGFHRGSVWPVRQAGEGDALALRQQPQDT